MPSFAASSPLAAVSNWSREYRWIPVAGGFVNFVWSVAVGANDVAISVCPHVWFSQCWLSNFINCLDKHALSSEIPISSNFYPGSAFCCPGRSPDSTTLQCVNETESKETDVRDRIGGLSMLGTFMHCWTKWNWWYMQFGTSVGSEALTMLQAVTIAAVLEISGAVFMGNQAVVTSQSSVCSFNLK